MRSIHTCAIATVVLTAVGAKDCEWPKSVSAPPALVRTEGTGSVENFCARLNGPQRGDALTALVLVCLDGPGSPCEGIPEGELRDGCIQGCMAQSCPIQFPCHVPSDWCGLTCDDFGGAVLWRSLLNAAESCAVAGFADQPALGSCVETQVETECSELAGTDWVDKLPGFYK